MTLQQLRYVVTVAEKGTLSDAAKELFISQPALTKAIRELEDEMNISIFNRTNKGVIVSHEGDRFLGYARQVLEQTDLLEEQYKKGNNITRRFSVSTQHYSFAVNAFVDVIKKFGENKYDFTLRETQTNEIIIYLNILGGTYLLDYFEENELKEKITEKIDNLFLIMD